MFITSSSNKVDDKSFYLPTNDDLCIFFQTQRAIVVFNTINGFNISVQYSATSPSSFTGTPMSGTPGVAVDFGINYGIINVKNMALGKSFKFSYTTFFSTDNSDVVISNKKISSYYSPNLVQTSHPQYFIYLGPGISRYMVDYVLNLNDKIELVYGSSSTYVSKTYFGPETKKNYVSTSAFYIYRIYNSSNSNVKITTTSSYTPDVEFMGSIATGTTRWIASTDFLGNFPSIPDGYTPPPTSPLAALAGILVLGGLLVIIFRKPSKKTEGASSSSGHEKGKSKAVVIPNNQPQQPMYPPQQPMYPPQQPMYPPSQPMYPQQPMYPPPQPMYPQQQPMYPPQPMGYAPPPSYGVRY